MKRSIVFLILLLLVNVQAFKAQTEISLVVSFPGDVRSETIRALIADYIAFKAAQGITVNVTINEPTEGYEDQLILDFASGISPDVFAISPDSLAEFAGSGLMLPIDDYLAGWDEWSNFPQAIQEMTKIDSVEYGVMHLTDTRVLWYRLDVFENAGIETPWHPTSWDEIFSAAEMIRDVTPNVIPMEVQAGTLWGEGTTADGFLMLFGGTGGILFDPSDQKWVVRSDALLQTFQFYVDMFGNNLSVREPFLEPEPWVPFLQEKLPAGELGIALGISGLYELYAPDSNWAPIVNRDEVLAWTPMPAREPGAGINGWNYIGYGGGWAWGISSDTENSDLAFDFVQFMSSADAIAQYADGLGGIPTRSDVATSDFNTGLIESVLPYQSFRPSHTDYPRVSEQIQIATERILLGESDVQIVMDLFADAVIDIVGEENTKSLP
jgi:multiple sugar transport system substrate-binding protein